MKILIASKNLHKVSEFEKIFKELNLEVDLLSLNDLSEIEEPIENGSTFLENAIIKAKYYYDHFSIPVLADDSGLCVDALSGLPGIYSARFASNDGRNSKSSENRKLLLKIMEGVSRRDARFICNLVFYDGSDLIHSEGVLEGSISLAESGDNGFGYDSIFIVNGYEVTLATLDDALKNNISHRYLATKELIKLLILKHKVCKKKLKMI